MKNIRYMIMAAFAALSLAACKHGGGAVGGEETGKQPEPSFPALVEKSVNAGESVNISFNANMDWELSMPSSDLAWFYIDDNGIKEYKVKGSKGSQTVTVYAENVAENYEVHVCKLTMKMGSKTQDVARITLIPEVRTVSIFPASVDADGGFTVIGSGEYEYQASAASSLRLSWPKNLATFSLPVRVVANFDWAIIENYPEWIDLAQTSSTDDETSIVLKGNPAKYPLDDASGKLVFVDVKNNDVVYEIEVSIPGCKDIVRTTLDESEIEINILGDYKQSNGWVPSCPVHVVSTLDSDVLIVERNGDKLSYAKESWVKLSVTFPEGQANANVIQERIFNVSAAANNGPAREAYLLAIPGYKLAGLNPSKDLLNSDATALSKEYEQYMFATVKQAGLDASEGTSAIVAVNTPYTMAVKGAGMHRTAKTETYYQSLSQKFGTDQIYTLEYNNWYSSEDAVLASLEAFDSCEFYLADGSDKDYSDYLSLAYPDESKKDMFYLNIEYFEDGYDCAAVLRNGGEVVAVIVCHMSDSYWPEVKYNDIHFTAYDSAGEDSEFLPQNVVLEELTSGDIYDQYKSYGIPVWRLVYESETSYRNAMISVPPFPMCTSGSIEINPQPAWINVEGALTEKNVPYIVVKMTDQNPESGNVGHIVLKGGNRPLFVLVCERAFMNKK